VVIDIPLDEPLQAILERCAWSEMEILREFACVGPCFPYVTRLRREEFEARLLAQAVFYDIYKVQQFNGILISQVVYTIRGEACGGIRVGAIPGFVRGGNMVHHALQNFHHVINIGEVPLHLAFSVDFNFSVFQNGTGKFKIRHVRSTPGTVNGEKPQNRAGQTVNGGVSMGHQLPSLFGCSVERDGMVRVIVNGEGDFGIGPIDGTRRGKHQMSHPFVLAALKNVEKTGNVARDVSVGIGQAVPYPRLCGEMDNCIKRVFLKQLLRRLPIRQIEEMEKEERRCYQPVETGPFEGNIVVVV